MGFRFRRSIKILPGIRINLSRSGVSASVGVRGANVTIGHGHVRETVGLPGSGLSYTHVDHLGRQQSATAAPQIGTPAPQEPKARGGRNERAVRANQ